MPPKRIPSKKGKKKKDAKGRKGGKGKKGKPKEKKIPKKYVGLTFDGINVYHKNREELEYVCETLRSQIDKERSERTKFQMERDMIAELNSLYLLRLKELRVKREWTTSSINRMNQDVADQKVIKAQEAKHFRYEAQLLLSSAMMRDEVRRKRLKGRIEKFWALVFTDGSEYDEKMKQLPIDYDLMITEKKAVLDADTAYIEEVNKSRADFAVVLAKAIEDSQKEIEIMGYFELASEKQRFNDVITQFSNNFEWIFLTAKNYYLDQVHNMLNVIVIMMDHWDEMDMDARFYEEQLRRYEFLVEGLERKQRLFQSTWNRAMARHEALLRLRRGLDNTFVKIRGSEKEMSEVMDDYKGLTHSVSSLEEDRILFKKAAAKCGCVLAGPTVQKSSPQPKEPQCCYYPKYAAN